MCKYLEFVKLQCSEMSKNRPSWLCSMKKLFFQDSQNQAHMCKRRRWMFGGERRPAKAPATEIVVKTTQTFFTDKNDEEAGHGDVGKSMSECENEVKDEASIFSFTVMLRNHVEHQAQAATKIQTAYRRHLARKALRALKGFVTLQAIIRGCAVRRQAVTTLKYLQSIVTIHSEICARRSQLLSLSYCSKNLLSLDACTSQKPARLRRRRRSDCDLLTKDEEIDSIIRKKEADVITRQRIKPHSCNHRISTDSEEGNSDSRLKYWLKQYGNDQVEKMGVKQPKMMRNMIADQGLHNYDTVSGPRRSLQNHNKKQSFCKEDSLHPSSPTSLPTYMAATKSAQAKTRSLSSPTLRPMPFDAYSDGDSPYKHKLSPMSSSINSDVTGSSFTKVNNKSCYSSSSKQKSQSVKGASSPTVRSNRIISDVCIHVH